MVVLGGVSSNTNSCTTILLLLQISVFFQVYLKFQSTIIQHSDNCVLTWGGGGGGLLFLDTCTDHTILTILTILLPDLCNYHMNVSVASSDTTSQCGSSGKPRSMYMGYLSHRCSSPLHLLPAITPGYLGPRTVCEPTHIQLCPHQLSKYTLVYEPTHNQLCPHQLSKYISL